MGHQGKDLYIYFYHGLLTQTKLSRYYPDILVKGKIVERLNKIYDIYYNLFRVIVPSIS